jgi:ATP-dependent helicase/nuclease subunit B
VKDFPGDAGPLALAEATIYVPTRRAALALSRALVEAAGGPSLILPDIRPLGAFEASEKRFFLDRESIAAPAAVGDLQRRMILASLTRRWALALRDTIDGGQSPALVAGGAAQAFALAGDLAALIDDMIIEGVDWARLDNLVAENFDQYWRMTLKFLKIAIAQWPNWLAESGLIDASRRGAILVDEEIARLRSDARPRPAIIAGSTGTNSATARLIAAIARAPLGAVVLPDLDFHLDEPSWAMIGARDDGGAGLAGHPQAALSRLLTTIGAARADVEALGVAPPPLRARASYLSEALRPADSTEFWRRRRDALSDGNIAAALGDVAAFEADNEAEEALALAIAMREALETPGKTAALITPDRSIARRVKAELMRWGVEVADSAGETLAGTPAGALARLILAAAKSLAALDLAALLAHPLIVLSRPRGEVERSAQALELGALRGPLKPGDIDDIEGLFGRARAAAGDKYAHRAVKALGEDDWRRAQDLLHAVLGALAPLRALAPGAPLAQLAKALGEAAAQLVAGEEKEPHADESVEALFELIEEWGEAADDSFELDLSDFAALFDAVAAQQRAPDATREHPRLKIIGLLEARLLSFDLALLAGLDETIWPPQAETDAFLNRPMRAQLGLIAPERRIGQTAHDFVAALGAGQAILSRSKKRGDSPTVASRFFQRLRAVAGDAGFGPALARGDKWLRLARAFDKPQSTVPVTRPEPRPPLALRPVRLSVTRIETLRRDPYAVYAESILKLNPLEAIGAIEGPREIGTRWHEALKLFVEAYPSGALPAQARPALAAIARARFAPLFADPTFAALNWPRIQTALDYYFKFEGERRAHTDRILVEIGGALDIALADGSQFRLTAKADRIDLFGDGAARLVDYKTGAMPGPDEIKVGLAPQLTLEAAMLERGGFHDAPNAAATSALYLKLGGAKGGDRRDLSTFKDIKFDDMVERHFAGLIALLNQFRDARTPYLSRPAPKFARSYGAYDHLARVKEWSATGGLAESGDGA